MILVVPMTLAVTMVAPVPAAAIPVMPGAVQPALALGLAECAIAILVGPLHDPLRPLLHALPHAGLHPGHDLRRIDAAIGIGIDIGEGDRLPVAAALVGHRSASGQTDHHAGGGQRNQNLLPLHRSHSLFGDILHAALARNNGGMAQFLRRPSPALRRPRIGIRSARP